MSETPDCDDGSPPRTLRTVQLLGFSSRDRELLRLFLRRPPGAGVSLTVVDDAEHLAIQAAIERLEKQPIEAGR